MRTATPEEDEAIGMAMERLPERQRRALHAFLVHSADEVRELEARSKRLRRLWNAERDKACDDPFRRDPKVTQEWKDAHADCERHEDLIGP